MHSCEANLPIRWEGVVFRVRVGDPTARLGFGTPRMFNIFTEGLVVLPNSGSTPESLICFVSFLNRASQFSRPKKIMKTGGLRKVVENRARFFETNSTRVESLIVTRTTSYLVGCWAKAICWIGKILYRETFSSLSIWFKCSTVLFQTILETPFMSQSWWGRQKNCLFAGFKR